jgi:hypothetical protein
MQKVKKKAKVGFLLLPFLLFQEWSFGLFDLWQQGIPTVNFKHFQLWILDHVFRSILQGFSPIYEKPCRNKIKNQMLQTILH